ncbi:MAG: sigma-70 family RNA polymerase sigma factor, partial [Nocardioidaceae bacterium]|nr:sigma-70 family RNA polymerase sigma factor [Nocardioidaceae bacterium]
MSTALVGPSDAELIARVRGGDTESYGLLFERHRRATLRLARNLTNSSEADDLVAEAFAKLLPILRSGGGPDVAFRAYVLTAVRHLHVDKLRSGSRLHSTDNMEAFDPGVPFTDTVVEDFERGAAARAFASLPERWQLVLWHCEVECNKPADVAPLLGMTPNSVAALAYRAREGLRKAYLRNHLAETGDSGCRWTTERLSGHIRGGLSRRDSAKVDQHVENCRRCAGVYLELAEVNSNLRGLLGPWLLGAAATGYFAACGKGAVASGVGATGLGVLGTSIPVGVAAATVTISAVAGVGVYMQRPAEVTYRADPANSTRLQPGVPTDALQGLPPDAPYVMNSAAPLVVQTVGRMRPVGGAIGDTQRTTETADGETPAGDPTLDPSAPAPTDPTDPTSTDPTDPTTTDPTDPTTTHPVATDP